MTQFYISIYICLYSLRVLSLVIQAHIMPGTQFYRLVKCMVRRPNIFDCQHLTTSGTQTHNLRITRLTRYITKLDHIATFVFCSYWVFSEIYIIIIFSYSWGNIEIIIQMTVSYIYLFRGI